MLNYLEASFYNNADLNAQVRMRETGLMPQEPDAEMPEPYRLWQACQRDSTLWWSGGISNQPYIMMLEFQACEYARAIFDEQLDNYQDILNNANTK